MTSRTLKFLVFVNWMLSILRFCFTIILLFGSGSLFLTRVNEIFGAIWLGYWGLSYFFFFVPLFNCCKPPIPQKLKNVTLAGHRGGSGERPENTMEAFRHAVTQGAQMFELDIFLTKDEQVVVFHDDTLERLTGRKETIAELNFDELPTKFLDEIKVDLWEQESFSTKEFDTRIPLLEDLFQAFPDLPMILELKSDSDILLKKTHELIYKYNRQDFTIWGGYEHKIYRKCSNFDPNICTYPSLFGTFKIITLYWLGLLPFVPISERFIVIYCFHSNKKNWSFKIALMNQIHHFFGHDRFFFFHLQIRKLRVIAWTLSSQDYSRAFAEGYDIFLSDFPTELNEFFSSNSINQKNSKV